MPKVSNAVMQSYYFSLSQSTFSSQIFKRNSLKKEGAQCEKPVSDTKEATKPTLARDKLDKEKLRSCFSATLFSLSPQSDHLADSSSREVLRRRQFTSKNCMQSLQAESILKEKGGKKKKGKKKAAEQQFI